MVNGSWKNHGAMVRDTRTHAARLAATARDAIAGAIVDLERQGRSPNVVAEAVSRMVEASIADVRQANTQRRDAIGKALNAEKARYERERSTDLTHRENTARMVRRYQGMATDELTAATADMETALVRGDIIEPDIIDALSASLKTADPDRHTEFRGTVKETRAYSPWEKTPTGKALVAEARATEGAIASGGVAVNIDGQWGVVPFAALLEENE
jgi:hypothetical protein